MFENLEIFNNESFKNSRYYMRASNVGRVNDMGIT